MEKLRCNICEIDIYVNDMNDSVQVGKYKIPLEVAAHIRKREHLARENDLKTIMKIQQYDVREASPSTLESWMYMLK